MIDTDRIFSYHAPTGNQPERYKAIRTYAKLLANVIDSVVPDGADKAAAIRKLRECVMTANAGIALEEKK